MTPKEHKAARQRAKFAKRAAASAHPAAQDSIVKMTAMLTLHGDRRGMPTHTSPRRQRAGVVRIVPNPKG